MAAASTILYQDNNYYYDADILAFESCVSSLSPLARTFLEKSLEWEKKDLDEVIGHAFDWEGSISTLLGLTNVEIREIKAKHPEDYQLQWYC